jgi:hypothetical protein
MHFLWGERGAPFATVVNSVVDPPWLQCGSRAGSSFYIIADLDPRELNPDPQHLVKDNIFIWRFLIPKIPVCP